MQATTSPISTTSSPSPSPTKESRNLYCLLTTSLVSLLFILSFSSNQNPSPSPSSFTSSNSSPSSSSSSSSSSFSSSFRFSHSPPTSPLPPSIAYFISGSHTDADRLLRLLLSVYHPRNHYLLHLDLAASQDQRDSLAVSVQSVPIFRAANNVNVVGKPDFANPRGSSALASTLHGAAILLRLGLDWDWFVNLSVADYPLVTQDDLLHVLSFLPKDLNFVQHTSHIGWRESRKIKPIVVDPGLYLSSKSDIFYATQKRELPNAYRLFTGLPFVIISRKLVEFCILGSDNLPRTLLMYYTNMPSPHANYFQTVVCNSREFNKTTFNNNLQYMSWDEPPKQYPRELGLNDFNKMVQSGAAFGTQFQTDDPVLDRIDREVLNRGHGRIVPGGWCLGRGDEDPCSVWGDAYVLRPSRGARRLEKFIVQQLNNGTFRSRQCIFE